MYLQFSSPLADKGFNFLLSGGEIGRDFVLFKRSWSWSTQGGLRTTRSIKMLTVRTSCVGQWRGEGLEEGTKPRLGGHQKLALPLASPFQARALTWLSPGPRWVSPGHSQAKAFPERMHTLLLLLQSVSISYLPSACN